MGSEGSGLESRPSERARSARARLGTHLDEVAKRLDVALHSHAVERQQTKQQQAGARHLQRHGRRLGQRTGAEKGLAIPRDKHCR